MYDIYSTQDAIADAARKMTTSWESQILRAVGVPLRVTCPRCKGSGEELVFMHYHTCQVCEGAKSVPKQTADDENAKRESEATWLKNK